MPAAAAAAAVDLIKAKLVRSSSCARTCIEFQPSPSTPHREQQHRQQQSCSSF